MDVLVNAGWLGVRKQVVKVYLPISAFPSSVSTEKLVPHHGANSFTWEFLKARETRSTVASLII